MTKAVLFLAILLVLVFFLSEASCRQKNKAQEVFRQRCLKTQQAVDTKRTAKGKGKALLGAKFCDTLWASFTKAYKSGNWDLFFKENPTLSFAAKKDTALFWSGTKDIAHDKAIFPALTTLEDTRGGSLFNALPNIKYNSAVGAPQTHNAFGFWNGASARFAKAAKGQITVALGGETPFNGVSIFRRTEMEHLLDILKDSPEEKLKIIVIPPNGGLVGNAQKFGDYTKSLQDLYDTIEDFKGRVTVVWPDDALKKRIHAYCTGPTGASTWFCQTATSCDMLSHEDTVAKAANIKEVGGKPKVKESCKNKMVNTFKKILTKYKD